MGMVQRFERRLQGAVGDAFARVFGGGVVPQEVEAALQQEASDRVRQLDGGHLLAPNDFVITINNSDHENLSSDTDLTTKAFSRHLEDYIREQGWQTYGNVVVRFEPSPTLHTGQFRTRGAVDPDAGRRPSSSGPPPSGPPTVHPTSTPGAAAMTQNQGHDPDREAEREQGWPQERAAAGRNGAYRNGSSYGAPAADPRAPGYDPRAYEGNSDPRGADPRPYQDYPPQQAGYDERGYDERGYGEQRAYEQQRERGYDRGYPGPRAYDQQSAEYDQQPQPGYDPRAYDQRPYEQPRAYEQAPGYDQQPGYDQPGYDQGRAYEQPRAYEAPRGYAPRVTPPAPERPAVDAGPPTAGYKQPAYGQDDYDYSEPAYATEQGLAATLQLEDGSGRYFQLREGGNIIGRGQDAQFRLPDTGVSRRHIEIRWDGRVAMLSDLGSTNGTTVNGAPVQDWQLADGDVIRAGHSEILVRIV